jgi:hypothetical protein
MTGDFKRGFITSGLFRYSRHPNFFAEQCVWWALALFSVAVTGDWSHWTFVGAVLLSLLFQVCILSAQPSPHHRPAMLCASRIAFRFLAGVDGLHRVHHHNTLPRICRLSEDHQPLDAVAPRPILGRFQGKLANGMSCTDAQYGIHWLRVIAIGLRSPRFNLKYADDCTPLPTFER